MDSHLVQRARIICVGNRFVDDDSLGMRVYDYLRNRPLPEGIGLVDGGLAGLDLLPQMENVRRVVFVDALADPSAPQQLQLLSLDPAASSHAVPYDHGNSFLYLLGTLQHVLDGPLPEVFVLGASGIPDASLVERTALQALETAGGARCNQE